MCTSTYGGIRQEKSNFAKKPVRRDTFTHVSQSIKTSRETDAESDPRIATFG